MKRLVYQCLAALLILTLGPIGWAFGQASFKLPAIGGVAMLSDDTTLVVTVPSLGSLIYFDTMADKELKRVEVEFQPTVLAVQKDKLFVGAKGASAVHVLDAKTGKETKEVKLRGEPLQAIACHPKKGFVYAVNLNNEVFSIDPVKGDAKRTTAKGQLLALDAGEGKYVYTGIQKPIRDQIVIQERGRGRATISLQKAGLRAIMLKYEIAGRDLKPAGANDNAAINGRTMAVSPDGKRIAMAGGGGWRSQTDPKANYSVAVFDTKDMRTLVGQIETGAYPGGIAFHPVLSLGAAFRFGAANEVVIFNAKSFVKKDAFKVQRVLGAAFLTFGARGTKAIFAPLAGPTPAGQGESVLEFLPLKLTDQEQVAINKAYAK